MNMKWMGCVHHLVALLLTFLMSNYIIWSLDAWRKSKWLSLANFDKFLEDLSLQLYDKFAFILILTHGIKSSAN